MSRFRKKSAKPLKRQVHGLLYPRSPYMVQDWIERSFDAFKTRICGQFEGKPPSVSFAPACLHHVVIPKHIRALNLPHSNGLLLNVETTWSRRRE